MGWWLSIATDEIGNKDIVGLSAGYRERAQSWPCGG